MKSLQGKSVLVTGGCGYIGSHTVVSLMAAGVEVTILDNLCNSSPKVIDRIQAITGCRPNFVLGDVRDREVLANTLKNGFDAVIHFAGLKAVGESQSEPLKYYDNNVTGSLVLIEEMARADIKTIVFSSSATVYGDPGLVCYTEETPLNPVNVYGRTKLMVEDVLRDVYRADNDWRIALLRYFNPVGAHSSGLIGEDPSGIPNNLMPFVAQVAVGKRDCLSIFGGDYPTPDGTGRRDFIHVDDLAEGHLAALSALKDNRQFITVNLGTGHPYSVLELVQAFEKASGKSIAYKIVERRSGDLPEYFADPSLARNVLGWDAKRGVDDMCRDTWNWQKQNPNGFETKESVE